MQTKVETERREGQQDSTSTTDSSPALAAHPMRH